SKYVAKVASDLSKPDGLMVVEAGQEAAFLAPLPIGRLYGVGRKTEELLRRAGLDTVAQVAACPPATLRRAVGARLAEHLQSLARGDDPRAVVAGREAVTVGSEETLEADSADRVLLEARILDHSDRVAARLRQHGYRARVVVLKVKYADFTLRTRRVTLPQATADGQVLAATARSLLARVELGGRLKLRLIGVAAAGIELADAPHQLSLLDPPPRGEVLGQTLDAISDRFGAGALRRATHLEDDDERE